MLLPPNATKQEKALVEAIDYKVDPSRIRGFKFSLGEKILPWLVEEYGLYQFSLQNKQIDNNGKKSHTKLSVIARYKWH